MRQGARGLGIADTLLGRDGMALPDPFDQQPNIAVQASRQRTIEEDLLEHILLCVTAAELIHTVDGRPHPGAGLCIFALGSRQDRLRDRQRVVAHQWRERLVAA